MSIRTTHLAVAVAVAIAAMLAAGCNQQSIVLLPDRSRTPPEIREACAMTEQKCSRCHDLERILMAHWALVDWGVYVDRMRRQPASGITVEDGKTILKCLNHIKQLQSHDTVARTPAGTRPAWVSCRDPAWSLAPRE